MRTIRCSGHLMGGGLGGLPRGGCLPGVHRILDTCLWKHYLSATSFADSNNIDDSEVDKYVPTKTIAKYYLSVWIAVFRNSKVLYFGQTSYEVSKHFFLDW